MDLREVCDHGTCTTSAATYYIYSSYAVVKESAGAEDTDGLRHQNYDVLRQTVLEGEG